MPSAREKIATAANIGCLSSIRHPKRASCHAARSHRAMGVHCRPTGWWAAQGLWQDALRDVWARYDLRLVVGPSREPEAPSLEPEAPSREPRARDAGTMRACNCVYPG